MSMSTQYILALEKTRRHTRNAAARFGITVERCSELVNHMAAVNPLAPTWGGSMASDSLGDTLKSACHMVADNPLARWGGRPMASGAEHAGSSKGYVQAK